MKYEDLVCKKCIYCRSTESIRVYTGMIKDICIVDKDYKEIPELGCQQGEWLIRLPNGKLESISLSGYWYNKGLEIEEQNSEGRYEGIGKKYFEDCEVVDWRDEE